MQYSLIDGVRSEPAPRARGTCPTCGAPTIAKCGPRILHHWAHIHLPNCDPWWENETQWHREWKALFPPECREVVHVAPDGEVHRADVKTSTGVVLEIQHSSISDIERSARETFYKNLVWLVDGRAFGKRFEICHCLPNPHSELARNLVWLKATKEHRGCARGIFYRNSENPSVARHYTAPGMVEIHGIADIEEQVNQSYCGHHQYVWERPHRTWLDARCPVFVDLGSVVVRLTTYDDTGLPCVYLVAKSRFVNDLMTKGRCEEVGTVPSHMISTPTSGGLRHFP